MMKHYILVPCLLFVSTLISSRPVLGQGTCSTCNLWNRPIVQAPVRVAARVVQTPLVVLRAPVFYQARERRLCRRLSRRHARLAASCCTVLVVETKCEESNK